MIGPTLSPVNPAPCTVIVTGCTGIVSLAPPTYAVVVIVGRRSRSRRRR